MNIDPKDTVGGLPIVAVRDALRRLRDSRFTVADLAELLGVAIEAAARVPPEVVTRGWIERVNGDAFEVTAPAGMGFTNASARPPFQRKVAQARLAELLERVAEVNAHDELVFVVDRVVLFGSMLDESRQFVSDVDVVVELVPRRLGDDLAEQFLLRARSAAAAGRRFDSYLAELAWAQTEVWQRLKGRSPVLQLVDREEGIPAGAPRRVLFERSSAPRPQVEGLDDRPNIGG